MFSVEKLTKNIAESISSELKLDNDRKEVIAYGTFALLHMTLSVVLVIIFGWMFAVLVESLIVSFTGSILRKYSGGVHASSPGICATTGTIITVGQALFICFILASFINLKLVIFLGLLTFVWSFYIIYKLAPVDSAAKPIKTQKKRERMKKGSILILGSYLVIVVLNIIMYLLIQEKKFLIFSLCIYGGTAWQAFTLTHGGHLAVSKIDAFINQILTFIRRIII
jgi:accessory gene regulator B